MDLTNNLIELTKNEVAFCEETEMPKNEHGVYIFISKDGSTHISLEFILMEYKQWLIEHKIVKEIK